MALWDILVDRMVNETFFSSLYDSSQTCRSGFEVSRNLHGEGGHGETRCFAYT